MSASPNIGRIDRRGGRPGPSRRLSQARISSWSSRSAALRHARKNCSRCDESSRAKQSIVAAYQIDAPHSCSLEKRIGQMKHEKQKSQIRLRGAVARSRQ